MPINLLAERKKEPVNLLADMPKRREPGIWPGTEKSLWQRFKESIIPGIDPEKATQAIIDSEALGISLSDAYEYGDTLSDVEKGDPRLKSLRLSTRGKITRRWDNAVNQAKQNYVGYQMLFDYDNPAYEEALAKLESEQKPEPIDQNIFEYAVGATAEILPIMLRGAVKGVERGLQFGMAGATAAVIAGQLGPQALVPEEIVTAPVTFAGLFGVGMTSGSLESIAEMEIGSKIIEIRKLTDSEGNKIDPAIVKTVAVGVGTLNSLIEFAQIKRLLKTIPGGEKLFGEIVKETTEKVLKSGALKTVASKYLKKYGNFISIETAQELAQEVVGIVGTELSKIGTDIPAVTLNQIIEQLKETALKSAAGFAVLGLPGTVVSAVSETEAGKKLGKKLAEPLKGEAGAIFPEGKKEPETKYKIASDIVSGLKVRDQVPNESSIESSLTDYTILKGIREISMSEFEAPPDINKRTKELAEEIKNNKEINPLIVVIDKEGAYILEGANRYDALKILGVKSIPAKIVIDEESMAEESLSVEPKKVAPELGKEAIAKAKVKEKFKRTQVKQEAITREKIEDLKRKGELDKLRQRIKDRFTFINRGVREGTIKTKKEIKAIQSEITDIIKASELPSKDRGKFLDTIKLIQTPAQLEKKMPAIQERIERMVRASQIKKAKSTLTGLLKKTKPVKAGKKPKGKFTPEIQHILDIVRKAMGLTQEKAELKLEENIDFYEGYRKGIMPVDVALENRVLDMALNNTDDILSEYKYFIEEITNLAEEGATLNALKKFNIASRIKGESEYLVETVRGGKEVGVRKIKRGTDKLKETLKGLGKNMIAAWPNLLDLMAWHMPERKSAMRNAFSVAKPQNVYRERQFDYMDSLQETISSVYKVKNSHHEINKIIKTMSDIVSVKGLKDEVTRGELIKRYMEFRDPTLYDSFIEGNGYTPDVIKAMENAISDKDKQFATAQLAMYREQYDAVNEVYKAMYGINLPFNLFYSPIRRKGYTPDPAQGYGEFEDEASSRRKATSPSALIKRVETSLPIQYQDSLSVLERHMRDTNYFIAWAERSRELDMTFSNTDVREAIKDELGSDVLLSMNRHLNDFITNSGARANDKLLDWIRKRFTLGHLMAKPALTVKQLVSISAYADEISPIQLVEGIADFLKNPVKNYKILKDESVKIRTRGKFMERDISSAEDVGVLNKYKIYPTLSNYLMMPIKFGDKTAIVLGSWAMRKARYSVAEYEAFSEETQQSVESGQLSNFQKAGSVAKLFTMFMTTQRQYLAKELGAVHTLVQSAYVKDKTQREKMIKKAVRTLVIFHWVLPLTFQYIVNFGGMDDEDIEDYKRAMWLGSLNGLFIIGEQINNIIRAALGMRQWEAGIPIFQILKDIQNGINKLVDDDEPITTEEFFEAVQLMSKAGNVAGYPVEQAFNISKGVGDILEGNIKDGLGLVGGWSEHKVKEKKTTGIKLKSEIKQ